MNTRIRFLLGILALWFPVRLVEAAPDFVLHDPGSQVFDQPSGVTMRTPLSPREDEGVNAYIKIGPSFTYNAVAVYYTDDGTEPQGSLGIPQPGTLVLLSFGPNQNVSFLYNEPGQNGNDDWWRADFPVFTRGYQDRIRYKIGAWDSNSPVPEVLAGSGTTYEWTNLLAWPGAGSGSPTPNEGYPPVHFWKEEGVVGNNYINVMVDQNGSVYDIYYPSAGCVQGMSTKNEGYADGLDTFPPGLPLDHRGQMNLNQALCGIRVDGLTYWLSNETGGDFTDVTQSYIDDTNVIETSQRLVANGNNILVEQSDFSPKDIVFPNDDGGQPNRGIYVKRVVLTNNGPSAKTVNFYLFTDYALNGGDGFDGTFTDASRGAMVGFDNTFRMTSGSGEYNPTTFSDYEKNVSVYIAAALKSVASIGGAAGQPAQDYWSDTSSDQGLGWSGVQIELPVGVSKEVNIAFVGGFDAVAGATGTYDYFIENALDWFQANSMSMAQTATENYWSDWLAVGVTIDVPDDRYDETFRRGLLATALHLDGKNGGIIAGMHNGAYPFVWPRDAAWAAITLARAAHVDDAKNIFGFLRDVAFRDVEGWGRKGFWKQKYSTDGYTIWGTPQVDETSCYPWGIKYIYDVTGEISFLDGHYDEVFEASIASSTDSTVDSRLRYEEAVDLVFSMNLWEDSFDVFNYSNASVIRGLEDAAHIATILDQNVCPGGPGTCGYHTDAANFTNTANAIRGGLDARLAWDGENTDMSQVGITYPFEIYPPGHSRIEHIMDRINGVATDGFGNTQPLMNFASNGEWEGLVNRYWGDGYWHNTSGPNANASPWFLTTMWYGYYYAMRQDINPGKSDIDNHKFRMDLLLDRLGPIGFGAEQIGPSNSLLYPGQTDFLLQTAWPNAWESMSFFVDAMMVFLDYAPDAPGNTLRVEPKLPTDWSMMTFNNLRLGDHRINVTCEEADGIHRNTFTNVTGNAVGYDTHIRVPFGSTVIAVTQDDTQGCNSVAFSHDPATGRVHVSGALDTGPGNVTTVRAHFGLRGDFDVLNGVDLADLPVLVDVLLGATSDCAALAVADMDGDGQRNGDDIQLFIDALLGP
ncbi:MAG: hypothetical protein MI923_14435 [Phycisphaerales bacterium]|nr:hypothetical protein [Phycisphaerales bacterium]